MNHKMKISNKKIEVSAKREFKLTEFQINTIELSIKEEQEKKRQFLKMDIFNLTKAAVNRVKNQFKCSSNLPEGSVLYF